MWSCQYSLLCKTHVTGSRKPYSIFGIRDFPLFETGDSGFYSTSRVSFGIESMSWGGEMQERAIGITWLNETLDRDYGIEEPYWGPLDSGFRIRKIFFFLKSRMWEMFLVESRILGFGIWNTDQGIWISLTIVIQIPSSTDKESIIQYLESRIQGVKSGIKECLGFSYVGWSFVFPISSQAKHQDSRENTTSQFPAEPYITLWI